MAGKVLKIDVLIDENGDARRNVAQLDAGLKGAASTADGTFRGAIERIQQKMDAADEAVEKMTDSVKQLEHAQDSHAQATERNKGAIDGLIGTIVGYISFNAVWGAITATAKWGSELDTLSARLRVPVDDLQRLNYAAVQQNLTLTDVVRAIGMLEQRVGDDNTGASGALNKLGIDFEHIRSSDPMTLFLNVADAIQRTVDPYEQAQRAQALFGREGNELLPLLTGNLRDVANAADAAGAVMDSGLQQRAAAADVTINNLTLHGKVLLAEFLDPLTTALTNLESHNWRGLADNLASILKQTPFGATGIAVDDQDEPGILDLLDQINGKDPGTPKLPKKPKLPQPQIPGTDPGGFFDPQTGRVSDEMTRQEQILGRELALQNQIAALEKERQHEAAQLANEMERALNASRQAFDSELAGHFMENLKAIKEETYGIRDAYLQMTLSTKELSASGISLASQYAIDSKFNRQVDTIDPRTDNAAALKRQYEAERDLAIIETKKTAEGMTMAIEDELNAFRIQYADIMGDLPIEFQSVVPPVLQASTAMKDGLTGDLGVVRNDVGATGQSFLLLGGNVNATFRQVADGLKAADDAYKKAGFVLMPNLDVSRLRGQQTGGLLYGLGGVVEPQYFALGGGPAGVDTVPAYLRPGEGVLSRTGMAALDRLNSGMGPAAASRGATIEKGAVTIDARGAQFADDRSLEALSDRVQQKLAALMVRNGG